MKVLGIVLAIICVLSAFVSNGATILVPLIAIIPANVAKNKGRDFWTWYVYGQLLWIIALIHSLVIEKNVKEYEYQQVKYGDMKRCLHCSELIKKDSSVCRYCGRSVSTNISSTIQKADTQSSYTPYTKKYDIDYWECLKCGCDSNTDNSNWCKECNAPRYSMDTISYEDRLIVNEYLEKMSDASGLEEAVTIQNAYFGSSNLFFLTLIVPDIKKFTSFDDYKKKLNEIIDKPIQEKEKKEEPVKNDDIDEQLQKAKKLFEKGLIDDTEYKLKKAKLLGL